MLIEQFLMIKYDQIIYFQKFFKIIYFFIKNKIAIWDLRKFSQSIGVTEEQSTIKKIQFSPSKSDRFAVLTENSTKLNVYRFEELNNSLYKETIQCN